MSAALPWYAKAVLVRPAAVERALDRLREAGVRPVPNAWQVALGVVRMWHRLLFRSGTVGTSSRPVRPGWRAAVFQFRAARLAWLIPMGAVAPLDFSGLLSGRERVIRHLLAAHHDKNQFAYDIEMLLREPGALDELLERARAVASGRDPRAQLLKDLTAFEGYHEDLVAAVERALAGDLGLSPSEAADPDVSFSAYLAWCARQPPTPAETLAAIREGRLRFVEAAP